MTARRLTVARRRVIARVSIAVDFAILAADVLMMHSALLLAAPVISILCGVAYLHSTRGQQ